MAVQLLPILRSRKITNSESHESTRSRVQKGTFAKTHHSRLGWSAFILSLFLLFCASASSFAAGSLSIQIDPANQADIYVYDVTAGSFFYSGTATSPLNLPIPVFPDGYHTFTVWVIKDGHRLLVNNWPKNNSGVPNDWTINETGDETTGEVQGGAEALHFDSTAIDLSITKECHDLIAGDQDVAAYTLTVTHESGWEDAASVTVADQLPAGLSNATYTVTPVPSGGSSGGSWPTSSPYEISLGVVAAGATHVIVIYADVALDLASIDSNTASVSDDADVYPDNNSDSCTNSLEPRGRIIVQKETDPSGNATTFDFTGDLGSFDLAGDGANESFTLVPGSYSVSETALTGWTLIGISDNDPDGGSGSSGNTATVDLDAGEIITVTFSNFLENADLGVVKSDAPDPVVVGGQLTYTIVVTNNGPSDATGVVVTDTLPGDVAYFSDTPSQGPYNSGTGEWSVGDLADGASATLTLVVTVGPGALPSITNTVCVEGDLIDPNDTNDCDMETTTVFQPAARITITPETDSNAVGDDHTFYALLEIDDDGDGSFDPVPAGYVVNFSSSGVGDLDALTGTTDINGIATVVLSSTVVGSSTVTANWSGTVANVTIYATPDSGDKTWFQPAARITITPETDSNAV
ncbi:hypothetical protein ACFLSF_04705, partial [Candidatus Bipolaricaulota bacterium]